MEYRILGPLEIAAEDRVIELAGTRERALLAVLLLLPNRVVAADRLVAEVWGNAPAPRSPASLRVHVSRLRKALTAAGVPDALGTRAPGYILRVEGDDLDAARFEDLVGQGRRLLNAGSAEEAADRFRAALGLWRGAAFANVAGPASVRAEAARLEGARLDALEDRVEADLGSGRHAALAVELEALTAALPLRERLWGQWVVALYRGGHEAAALEACKRVRARLSEELGIEPTPALRRLEEAVRTRDPALGWPPAVAAASRRGPGPRPRDRRPAEPAADVVVPSVDAAGVVLPLPGPLSAYAATALVGRRAERQRLDEQWVQANSGRRLAVMLAGEPGIGKTRLAAAFAAAIQDTGAVVLYGRCDEESVVPYQPFVEAVRPLVAGLPDHPAMLGKLGGLAGELVRIAPELAGRLPGPVRAEPETERYRLFEAVDALVAAGPQPVLLIVDDLQWCDRPSSLMLRHIVRGGGGPGLLIVGTYRDEEIGRGHPLADLLGDLRRDRLVERIALRGLSEADVGVLVRSTSGAEVPVGVAASVHARTDGNPLFVGELVRHLVESSAPGSDWWSAPPPGRSIPSGVAEVLERRLVRLSPDANSVLALGAVNGREFTLELLGKSADLSSPRLIEVLEEVAAAGLVREVPGAPGRYTFSHVLVREAVYDRLTAARRTRLHRRIGEALEELYGPEPTALAELAWHFSEAAAAGDGDRAVDYCRRAGEHAARLLAYDEAAGHYERALNVLDASAGPVPDRLRADILIALGDALWQAGDRARATKALNEALSRGRALGDPVLVARAVISGGFAGKSTREGLELRGAPDQTLIDLLQEALAGLPEEDSALRARLLGRLAAAVYWVAPRDERARLAQDALDMARRTDDAEALLAALANYHYAVWGPEDLESQLAAATEIAEVADRVGLPEQALEGRILRIVDLFTLGRLETVHEEIDAVVVRAEELRQPSYRWQAANLVAMRALLEGRFDDAERLSAEALAIGEQAQDPNAIVLWGTQMAWLWRDRGATAELEVAMHGIVETFGAIPAAQAGLAWIAIELGRFDDARTAFERLAANDFDDLPRDIAWLVGVCILADTCTALGDVERAGTLYGLLWPYAALNVMTWINFCAGPVDHYLGLLAATRGQTEQAIGHFESALAMGVALGARPRTARTQFAYARVLLARDQPGDAARARQLLAAAGLTASELDMRPLAAQVAALASEL